MKPLTPQNLWNYETIDTTKPMKLWNHWHHETYETMKPLTPRNLWNYETNDTTEPRKPWNPWHHELSLFLHGIIPVQLPHESIYPLTNGHAGLLYVNIH